MKKTLVVLAVLAGLFVLSPAPVQAAPVQEAKYAAVLTHENAGNDQAFAVWCENWTGPYWVKKNQDTFMKCASGYAVLIDVPDAFDVTCKSGADRWTISGLQGPLAIPTSNWRICWTNKVR